MAKLFGTDGVRGRSNTDPITADMVLKLAQAAAVKMHNPGYRNKVVIGKDTRLSSDMLEAALTAGFTSMGMDVILIGILPTPAVAVVTSSMRADIGVMITASHNLYEDNGIKFFGPDGYKISDEAQSEIEYLVDQDLDRYLAFSPDIGRITRDENEAGRYIEHMKFNMLKGIKIENMKVVLDCAHGAAYKIAPTVLRELWADVVVINSDPNGMNINKDCGATSLGHLQDMVHKTRADIGLALDGDGDRLIVCDERGKTIDGDQIIALIGGYMKKNDLLKNYEIVATIMSNMGLERYFNSIGLKLHRTQVGDRNVLEYMRQNNCNLGGEQSGHIILGDYGTTGDGIAAALQVLRIVSSQMQKPVSEICKVFKPVPQVSKAVKFKNNISLESEEFKNALKEAENKLGEGGRIIVRKSGTEPVIRIMAESDNEKMVKVVVEELCEFVKSQDK